MLEISVTAVGAITWFGGLASGEDPVGFGAGHPDASQLEYLWKIWDARRRCLRKTGVIALPIHIPKDNRQLFLVVSRPGSGRKPGYLITPEPVSTAEQAWKIVFAYARRCQSKCSCALPNPRYGKLDSNFSSLLLWLMPFCFLSFPTQISFSP